MHHLTLGTARRDAAGNVVNAVLLMLETTGATVRDHDPGCRPSSESGARPGRCLGPARQAGPDPDPVREPCDVLFQFQASFDYDPRSQLDQIAGPFSSINFADDLLNPPELLHLPNRPNLHDDLVSAAASLYGHETLKHSAGWQDGLRRFLDSIPGWAAG